MHLKKIKLAGFKSFVDPTTVELRSKIAAIVGPNGCGKSNIIDAVRWVMGESSAKQLRGESMADVIFNGSLQRKPLGQASIELIFDNSDAKIGGEYSKYGEISVRREVGRDGGSSYYLNGAICRRRDITDIFLGTGLGANSYAIIEQGTISQFVEAKPDDLRLYLEEAAGISKYKERRRETENRIRHTHENLARLNDIRLELEAQLKHLKSQANAAERFKKLKQEERQTKAELHGLHWRALHQQLERLEAAIIDEAARFEDQNIAYHSHETKINVGREQHQEATGIFNAVQENFYRIGAEIARFEQQLQHEKERKKNLIATTAKLDQSLQETAQHQRNDQGQLNVLQDELNKLSDTQPHMAEKLLAAEKALLQQEHNVREFQQSWDAFNAEMANGERNIVVAHTKMQHTQQTINNEEQRLHKLRSELAGLIATGNREELGALEKELAELQQQSAMMHAELGSKQKEIHVQREMRQQISVELDGLRRKIQVLAGKYASLESLQEAALGRNDAACQKAQKQWLHDKQLAGRPRLLQELKVMAGWERAVEVVLGGYLDALHIDDLALASDWQNNLPINHLFLCDNKSSIAATFVAAATMPTLLSKIENSDNHMVSLLAGIYIADSLAQALAMRANLAPYESIITSNGIWLGSDWLSIPGKAEQQSGVIQREREIKEIKLELQDGEKMVAVKAVALQRQQDAVAAAEQSYHEMQQKLREITAALGKVQGTISAKRNHANYLEQRQRSLQQEVQQHENTLVTMRQQLEETRRTWEAAASQKEQLCAQRIELQRQREKLQQELNSAREQMVMQRKMADTGGMRVEMLQTQIGYLQNNLDRAAKKLNELESERAKAAQELSASEAPIAAREQEMQHKVGERFGVEKELQTARQKVSECENLLREFEEQRSKLQDEVQVLRDRLEKLRIEAQELKTKKESYGEQIRELEHVAEELLKALTEEMNIVAWEEKLAGTISRIERLGAINLAAIDEFAKQSERKDYLDKQNQDLLDALTTLEGAINKIDQETKEQFNAVFNEVNQRFQELFPRIFNGGKAYLEMFGDNLLESGVAIFAQPPGKRNSSIHLLSGGEKALTAIALIFAIFQRNPAPFCILDEVDAPLDDTNVLRFCNLMKEIAAMVQLIFISHNKITLEIAEQLTGVTMQEPGVSRVVEVDVQKALEMVEK
jgi:chromosome segregation protein